LRDPASMTNRGCLLRTASALALLLVAPSLRAEVIPLPPVAPPAEPYPGRLASHAGALVEVPDPVVESVFQPENPDRPPDARDGMFQKLIFNSTWLDSGGNEGMGISELELKTVLGLPIPSRRSPLILTPTFSVDYLDEPVGADLPPRVYEASVQFRWWKRFTPRFGIDFALTPGVYSDFQQSTDEAFRIPGHVVARFEWTPSVHFVLGAAYLDRPDLDVIPIGGIVWIPHEDLKLDLVFPYPRIARRVYWLGAFAEEVQHWAYVAGEFGTKTWAIHRAGTGDVLTSSDCRLLLGLQRKALHGLDVKLEVGYVFSRELRFASGAADIDPADTVMLRLGLTY
jgi:hypothetical protein